MALFLGLASIAGAQGRLPLVAVLDFKVDESISKQQQEFIAGELASELIKTNAFTVLDRGRMGSILEEQGFQQSGACNSSECQVQVGQLLGVDNLVAGSMVRFGPRYAFRIEYLDVATGRIQKSISFEKKGELHEIYRIATQESAQALARHVRGETVAQPELAPATPVETGIATTIPPPRHGWKLPVVLGLLAGGLTCGVLGFQADQELGDARIVYDSLQNPTLAEADAQWEKGEDAQSRRNIFYGVGAGLLASGITVQFVF